MAEVEFGGMTFKGGKMFAILTALSTLGGGAWAGFEFYSDYMDMKEVVQNIDIDAISSANELQLQKLEDAIGITNTILCCLNSCFASLKICTDFIPHISYRILIIF